MLLRKDRMDQYRTVLQENRRKSLSKLCNSTEIVFLSLITIYLIARVNIISILLTLLSILFLIRLIYIYFVIADCLEYKFLFFSMILALTILSGIALFTVNLFPLIVVLTILLVGFPFLFDRMAELKQS